MSNIHTLPNRAPRVPDVPAFTPKINSDATDDERSKITWSHKHFLEFHANGLASLEGTRSAVGALLDIIEDLQRLEQTK